MAPDATEARLSSRRRRIYGLIFGLLLLILTASGTEAMMSFLVPSWPARALRPVAAVVPDEVHKPPFSAAPWLADPYNSWGMRDRERTIAPVPGRFRAVFVGDSFVESVFTPLSLPAAVEQTMSREGRAIEAVNLGVTATDPRSYYYRIRDVATELSPKAIVLIFCAGNDFVQSNEGYSVLPRLIGESAGGSLLGWFMPRTNWLLVNRLRLAEIFPKKKNVPANEAEQVVAEMQQEPRNDGVKRLAAHFHKYRYPERTEAELANLIGAGNGRLLKTALAPSPDNPEFLVPLMVDQLLGVSLATYDSPATPEEAVQIADKNPGEIEATASWIEAVHRLARERGIALKVFVAPTGTVDPDYVSFWKPWPRYYGWNLLCDERVARLVPVLKKDGIDAVDLRSVLQSVPGTYRKLDGHWTQKGEAIVAERMAQSLAPLVQE